MTESPLRILVLDDDREGVELIRDLLKEETGMDPDLVWAASIEEGLRMLRTEHPDVCLVDDRLGSETGIDFLKEPAVGLSGLPVVFMTRRGTPEVDRMAMEAGAVDYLPREEFTGRILERTIRYAVERRRREKAETHVKALLGSIQEIVSVLDTDGTLRYVSPSLSRVLGFQDVGKVGADALAEVHPDDQAMVTEVLRSVLEHPTDRMELTYRVRHQDGSWRILDTIAQNHLEDPHIRGIVLSSRDVTERVVNEERIRFQAGLLDAVGQAVIATDIDGIIVYWNRVAEALYGWSSDEALGRSVMDLHMTPDNALSMGEILEAVRRDGLWTGEIVLRRADGSSFTALVSNSLLRDSQDSQAGIVGVSSDITNLKETERALRERVKELRVLTAASEILNLPELSIEERLHRVVELLPSGWQHPERTEVRLVLEGQTIQTDGFHESPWMQRVVLEEEENGPTSLEVAYSGSVTDGRDPFLPEEAELLRNLGRIMSDAIGRASLQRLIAQAFASIQEAVLVIDSRDGGRGIRYLNTAAERMFGYAADELLGGTTEPLHVDRDTFEQFAEEGNPVLERDGVFCASYPMRRKDGSVFDAEQTVTLLNQVLGFRGGAVSVVRDISESHATERALRESEERFRQIAEHIEDVFWIRSPDQEVMEYVSPAYAKVWGRPVDELNERPRSWLDAIAPADRDRVRDAILAQARAPHEQEFRVVRSDGDERWIVDRSYPVRNSEGTVTRIIGVARDVTEERRVEERFGRLSQEISDVIFVLTPDGTVQMSTPSVYAVTGFGRKEFEQMNALALIHPEDREDVQEVLEFVSREADQTARTEHRIITSEGEVRDIESVARNLLHDPAIRGILVTARDITERTRLERRVQQIQKMESIGQLAGGIAHDFNNILTVIRAQTDLMLMELPDESGADDIRVIQSAADRATTLTGQLLAFSRDQVLQPRVVDLAALVQGTGTLIERVFEKNIHIEYDFEPELAPVRLDPWQLEQVLFNLALNARDAMPDGGTLTFTLRSEVVGVPKARDLPGLVPGPYVALAVTDTGLGMTEEVRQRVFEPFFTTKPKDKGTGLGLAMVYGTVKQSGGSIHVDSTPGAGSTFTLRFPPVEGALSPTPPESPAMPQLQSPLAAQVLVIEDNPAVRRAIEKVLEKSGFQVAAYEDAESGLDHLDGQEPVEVVLTDLMLPGMSGYELLERVRSTHPELPVMVMSGYAEGSPGRSEGLPPDVTFVQKPFTPKELVEALRAVLGVR